MTPAPEESLIFTSQEWQMSLGERAALTGVLAELQPEIALEIGIGTGGSLAMIARSSHQVHAFDLSVADDLPFDTSNVEFHVGDTHLLLAPVLEELTGAGRSVDFVLVDGDHSADGVQRDLQDLLESPCLAATVVLVHDAMNPEVQAGLDALDFFSYPRVRHLDLEFLPGYVAGQGPFAGQQWGGFALLIIGSPNHPVLPHLEGRQSHFRSMFEILRLALDIERA